MYVKELDQVKTVEDCQRLYDKYIDLQYKSLLSEGYDESDAVNLMICEDFNWWESAEDKASKLNSVNYITEFDDVLIKSKY